MPPARSPRLTWRWFARLEHHCGPLIQRSPRPAPAQALTPLGEQLRIQARDYLGLTVRPGRQPAIITRSGFARQN
jgi:hypothetical protein